MATRKPRRTSGRGQGSCGGTRLHDGGGKGVGRKPRRKPAKK